MSHLFRDFAVLKRILGKFSVVYIKYQPSSPIIPKRKILITSISLWMETMIHECKLITIEVHLIELLFLFVFVFCFVFFCAPKDWIDEFRMWNPDQYCGIKEIDVLSKELWLPDLTLLNRYVAVNMKNNPEIYKYIRILNFFQGSQLGVFFQLAIVYYYLEFKLLYLKNMKKYLSL